jgi:TrmH family RNA methyltransferase
MRALPPSSEFDRLCVVLVSTRNPLNIGAAARAMSNLGFLRLRVVNPYEASFREARSAVGARPLLKNAEEYSSVADAVADCSLVVGTTAARDRELHHPLKLLPDAAAVIRKRLGSGRVALLFGSEKRGLANTDLSHCHWLLHIPTREEHISMNLGQAVAVCLYELARNLRAKRPDRSGPAMKKNSGAPARRGAKTDLAQPTPGAAATAGDLERITALLLQALKLSGYLGQGSSIAEEEKVRRMVRRLKLTVADADLWPGMLRQIIWKLEHPDKDQ